MIWVVKKLLGVFMKKICKKTSQQKFRIEKVLERKGDNYTSNGKGIIIVLIVGLIKKISYVSKRH